MATSFVGRMIGAATLNRDVYREIEQDSSATGQAAIVVIVSSIAAGIGSAIGSSNFVGVLIGGILGSLLGWVVFAFLAYLVGSSLFKANTTSGEVLRCLGFAQAPGVLRIIPCIGAVIGGIWMLVSSYVALKEALDLSTGQTIITIVVSFIGYIIVFAIFAGIFGLFAAATGAITGG